MNNDNLSLNELDAGAAEGSGGGDALRISRTAKDLEAVYDIPVQVSAVLGRATMQVSQLLKLGRGAVVELDRKVGEAVDIYVNNRLVARGEVVLVDEHLGVDAQVAHAGLLQHRAHGIGHAADADLQAGAIVHLRSDEGRDLAVDLADRRVAQFGQRIAAFVDEVVDLADVDRVLVAENLRHMLRHFDHDAARTLRRGMGVGCGKAEVETAVCIHRCRLQDQDVTGINEAAIPVRHLAEVHRHVIAATGVVLLAVIAGEVPAEPVEGLAIGVAFQHGTRAHAQAGPDVDAAQLALAGRQCLIEAIRLAQAETPIQPHAGLDQRGSFHRRDLADLSLLTLKCHFSFLLERASTLSNAVWGGCPGQSRSDKGVEG